MAEHGFAVTCDGREYHVDEYTHEAIRRLVESGSICRACGQSFAHTRPEVYRNTCLPCYLASYPCVEKDYRFIGFHQPDDSNVRYAQFIDPRGYVYEISPDYSSSGGWREPALDEIATLLYWGYPIPFPFAPGQERYRDAVSIYGTLADGCIVVMFYARFGNAKSFTYLLTNDGAPPLELTRTKPSVRKLLGEASARVLARQSSCTNYDTYLELIDFMKKSQK